MGYGQGWVIRPWQWFSDHGSLVSARERSSVATDPDQLALTRFLPVQINAENDESHRKLN